MTIYTFLRLNGYLLDVSDYEVVTIMEEVASDRTPQDTLAQWLQENSHPEAIPLG